MTTCDESKYQKQNSEWDSFAESHPAKRKISDTEEDRKNFTPPKLSTGIGFDLTDPYLAPPKPLQTEMVCS